MSSRPSELPVAHSFPPGFKVDTSHLSEALAEFNRGLGIKLRFDQLSNDEMHWVIAKAQELKTSGTGSPSTPIRADQGEIQTLASSDPVPEKAASENLTTRARRFVRCLVPWGWA